MSSTCTATRQTPEYESKSEWLEPPRERQTGGILAYRNGVEATPDLKHVSCEYAVIRLQT